MARPHWWTYNVVPDSTLTPSSASYANPVGFLIDGGLTSFWRTATGWTITDHNNKLDFNRGGVKTATIANGTYTTGASLAAAIVTALEAADATPVWACDYNVTSAYRFTIDAGTGYSILWQSGANAYRSIGRSLGFDTGADDASLTFYTSHGLSYQSTHYLVLELPQARTHIEGAALLGHNVSASATSLRLEAAATDTWSTPTLCADFTTSTRNARAYFESPAHSFYRLVVDDVANDCGYLQLGGMVLAAPTEMPYFSVNRSDSYEDYSGIAVALNGAQFTAPLDKVRVRSLGLSRLTDSEWTTVRAVVDQLSLGQSFVLDLDPDVSARWSYGFLASLPAAQMEANLTRDVGNITHVEATLFSGSGFVSQ